jgi:thioredoxin-like negative regulator of GroEL
MAIIEATDSNFQDILKDNQKVIVKYYADWCGNCRLFKPKFKRLSEDARFGDVAFVDVNAEENPEARKIAGVDNLPFFAVFKDGKLVQGQPTSKEDAVVGLITQIQ